MGHVGGETTRLLSPQTHAKSCTNQKYQSSNSVLAASTTPSTATLVATSSPSHSRTATMGSSPAPESAPSPNMPVNIDQCELGLVHNGELGKPAESSASPALPSSPLQFSDDSDSGDIESDMNIAASTGYEKLGVLPFAVIIFYSVSGGPFGIESAVRSGGYLPAILGFAILPFVWSIPEALMTSELGTALPEASAGVAWVETAFGPNWAFLAGYLSWISGATDNAIYPVLFLEYLLQAFFASDADDATDLINPFLRFGLIAAISISLGYINWLGLPTVGHMSISICIVAMSPFIILTLVGMFDVDPQRWLEMPSDSSTDLTLDDDGSIEGGLLSGSMWGGILWRPFLNNLFWNLNSFDSAGSFVEDIKDPPRVLPRSMMWSVLAVVLGYLIPLLVAIGASDASVEPSNWVDGYLARVTTDVVGPWLGAWTVLAAGISNIGLFQAELSADALQLMGMADKGYVPKVFAQRSKHGTPTYGIGLGVAIIIVLGISNLDELIEMLNFNYSLSLLLEYAAFLYLRIYRPDLHRPYRIPLSTAGCFVLMTPTILLTVFMIALASYKTLFFAGVVSLIGVGLYQYKHVYERVVLRYFSKRKAT